MTEHYTVRVFPRWEWYWPVEIYQGTACRAVGRVEWWWVMFKLGKYRCRFGRSPRWGERRSDD